MPHGDALFKLVCLVKTLEQPLNRSRQKFQQRYECIVVQCFSSS